MWYEKRSSGPIGAYMQADFWVIWRFSFQILLKCKYRSVSKLYTCDYCRPTLCKLHNVRFIHCKMFSSQNLFLNVFLWHNKYMYIPNSELGLIHSKSGRLDTCICICILTEYICCHCFLNISIRLKCGFFDCLWIVRPWVRRICLDDSLVHKINPTNTYVKDYQNHGHLAACFIILGIVN